MKNQTNIILKQFELGPLNNFLYFLGDPQSREIAVIDPAWDVPFLIEQIVKNDYQVSAVFLTHGHPDHVNGLETFLKRFNVPIYINKFEHTLFKPTHPNLKEVTANDVLKVGNLRVTLLHTPGHSPGCQCFLIDDVLLAGDTIFIDGCGRCDLPGSDPKQMYDSLYNKIMPLPDNTLIYPGHNYGPVPFATLAEQKQTNPYLQCKDIKEFLRERMGIF